MATETAPPRPAGARRFYGWRMVVMAAVATGLTAPGQTVGVSVFIDHMIGALDLSRSTISTAYLVGTMTGALVMPRFGTVLDRRGTRWSMSVVATAFAIALLWMSRVDGLLALTIGFAGIRTFGQGALTLTASTAVSHWFERRRGFALGLTTSIGVVFMSLAPVLLNTAINGFGWRLGWVVAAVVVFGIAIPMARLGIRDRPEDVGQLVDGDVQVEGEEPPPRVDPTGMTRSQAVRTPMFWALTGAMFAPGLIGTGLAFHQISILGERGLSTLQAAANFVPQTAASLLVTLVASSLVDRVRPRWIIVSAMTGLSCAMLLLQFVTPGLSAILYGMLLGVSGSAARAVETAAIPRFFGTLHLGAIRGFGFSLTVAGSAVGPLLLSLGRDLTGSYPPVLNALLVLPLAVAITALLANPPRERHDDP